MAKYTVTRACGHSEQVDLFGTTSERERKMSWMRKTDCAACYKAAVAERKAQLMACETAQDIMRYVCGDDYDYIVPAQRAAMEDTIGRIITQRGNVPQAQLREAIEWAIGQTVRKAGDHGYISTIVTDRGIRSYEARVFAQALIERYC